MGVDFLRNKRQQHKKAWNSQMLLRTEDLFAAAPKRPSRVFRSAVTAGACPRNGSEVLIRRLSDGNVVISQDISLVAAVNDPAKDLMNALERHDGILAGRVYECFDDLGIVDIETEL
jgi:hypothetical protein